MPGHIPDEIIDKIRGEADIVDVISPYLPLKKAGANFKANCPFHHEKTPSFHVSPSKQIFHCFGCHAGGNVFNFLMKHEQMTFPEAVELLADKLGIQFERTKADTQGETGLWRKRYFSIQKIAAEIFRQAIGDRRKGHMASAYLSERGITEETAATFNIGFAEDGWETIVSGCRKEGFQEKEIVDSGLAIIGQKGKPFDRFRKRIMFPIYDRRDQIVAFGGRVLDNSLPKYMNSPESEFYIKSKILYGLNFTKPHVLQEDKIILLEGYTDLISLYQAGIKNVAAPLGTALTVDHIRLFKRLTSNAVIVFDADQAGEDAMLRSSDLMIQEEVNVSVVTLPAGEDPDTFLRESGADEFRSRIERAQSVFDFRLGCLLKKFGNDDVESRVRVANEMMVFLAKISNAVLKGAYIRRLAEKLELTEDSIYMGMKDLRHPSSEGKRFRPPAEMAKDRGAPWQRAEILLLGLLFDEPGRIKRLADAISLEWITDGGVLRVLQHLLDISRSGQKIETSRVITDLKDEKYGEIISEAVSAASIMDDGGRAYDDCLKKIKETRLKKERRFLEEKLKLSEREGKDDELVEIVKEISRYDRLIKSL